MKDFYENFHKFKRKFPWKLLELVRNFDDVSRWLQQQLWPNTCTIPINACSLSSSTKILLASGDFFINFLSSKAAHHELLSSIKPSNQSTMKPKVPLEPFASESLFTQHFDVFSLSEFSLSDHSQNETLLNPKCWFFSATWILPFCVNCFYQKAFTQISTKFT